MLGSRCGIAVVDVNRRIGGETFAQITASRLEQLFAVDEYGVDGATHAACSGSARGNGDVLQVLRLHGVSLQRVDDLSVCRQV